MAKERGCWLWEVLPVDGVGLVPVVVNVVVVVVVVVAMVVAVAVDMCGRGDGLGNK